MNTLTHSISFRTRMLIGFFVGIFAMESAIFAPPQTGPQLDNHEQSTSTNFSPLLTRFGIFFGTATLVAATIEYLKESELSIDEIFTKREMPAYLRYLVSTYSFGFKGDRVTFRNFFHNHKLFLLFFLISSGCLVSRGAIAFKEHRAQKPV